MGRAIATGSILALACSATGAEEAPVLVAEENDAISALAVDATHVFFASGYFIGGGPVQRIPKEGGPRVILGAGEEFATSLKLDATTAYWVDGTTDQITFAAKDGTAYDRYPKTASLPLSVALEGDTLYFTTAPQDPSAPGSVWRMEKDGTGARELASGQAYPVGAAVDSRDAYWVNHGSWPSADGALARTVKEGGGPVTVLADALVGPVSVVVGEGHVYFSVTGPDDEAPTGSVMRVPKGGGAAVILAEAQAPHELALSGGFVYAAAASGVLKIPAEGGEPVVVAPGPARQIAVDDTHVYFGSDSAVYKVRK